MTEMGSTQTDPGRSFAERILTELRELREETPTLRRFAALLGTPPQGQTDSFMTAVTRLLHNLTTATEETHRRLEALHTTVTDPRMTAALRMAIVEN